MGAAKVINTLRNAGLSVSLTPDHRVKVAPASQLTEELRGLVRTFRAELVGWLEAANDPAPDLDRGCWPHSDAIDGEEIDRKVSRIELFVSRGLTLIDATSLADKLVKRDREGDDRSACLECANLGGWEVDVGHLCSASRRAGLGQAVPAEWLALLQRCRAFAPIVKGASMESP
jgi:hypothetical protein